MASSGFNVEAGGPVYKKDIEVDPPRPLRGNAVVADGRPLGGATVDAVPIHCLAGSSPWCMPRPAQTTTAANGSFYLGALDPGRYLLRVRPADGTRLPWKVVSAFPPVEPAGDLPPLPIEAGTIVVPAPVSAGLQLLDSPGEVLIRAVVRVFTMPVPAPMPPAGPPGCTPGATTMQAQLAVPAIEVGQAITDAQGKYELYLAPPTQ